MDDSRLAAAATRALGGLPTDHPLASSRRLLAETTEAAGNRLMTWEGGAIHASRHVVGFGEATVLSVADPQVPVATFPRVPLLVIGTLLRACWPDPADQMLPGQPTTEDHLVAVLHGHHRVGKTFVVGAIRNVLPAAGWLVRDRVAGNPDGADRLRLGPAWAQLTDGQRATFRASWHLLPHLPAEPTP